MRRREVCGLGAAGSVLAVGAAAVHAGLIPGFELLPGPGTNGYFVDVSYSVGDDALVAEGFVFELVVNEANEIATIEDGLLRIEAEIGNDGSPRTGSLLVLGSVPALGVEGPGLLDGTLRDFGYGTVAPSSGPFQFVFSVTGGQLAALFGGAGAEVGVSLTQDLGFNGTWAESFNGHGSTIASMARAASGLQDSLNPCHCVGDVNCDGIVGIDDMVMIVLNWGECEGCAMDISGNGSVDVEDMVELILHWGYCQ